MRLSVIIPFYKDFERLVRLCNSIIIAIHDAKLLAEFEILIVNDFPEDAPNSNKFIAELANLGLSPAHIVWINNEINLGVAGSRNSALELAKGDFIHVIDQDDEIDKEFYIHVFKGESLADFNLVNGKFYHETTGITYLIYYIKPDFSLKTLILDDFLRSPGQVVFARKLLSEIKFPEPIFNKGCDDRFFWISILNKNPNLTYRYISKPLYTAYLHGSNNSLDSNNLYLSCLELWDKISLPREFQLLVDSNIRAIKYAIGVEKSGKAFFSFLRYKFRLNRILRFLIKRVKHYA